MKNAFLSLDIGTNNIYAVLFKCDNKPQVLSSLKRASSGVRKGAIQNVNEVVSNIDKILDDINQISNTNINFIITSVAGADLNVNKGKGIALISGKGNEINEETIERAQNSSQAIFLPPSRAMLHNIPIKYIIDGNVIDQEPIGMSGIRLEIESMIIDSSIISINNINQIVNSVGVRNSSIFAGVLASTYATLTKQEKDLGVVAIDLGASTTSMTVFEEGKLIAMKVFPVGGNNISNDICLWLQIHQEYGEQIKLKVGSSFAHRIGATERVNLNDFIPNKDKQFYRKQLAEVIDARIEQIFDLVNSELRSIGKMANLPGGAVLYGGGALMPLITEFAEEKLRLPVRIAMPEVEGFINEDPGFATALGNIKLFLEKNNSCMGESRKGSSLFSNIFKWFEKI